MGRRAVIAAYLITIGWAVLLYVWSSTGTINPLMNGFYWVVGLGPFALTVGSRLLFVGRLP